MLYLSAFLGAKTIAKVETFFRNKVKKTIFFRAQKSKKNAQKLAYLKGFRILQQSSCCAQQPPQQLKIL